MKSLFEAIFLFVETILAYICMTLVIIFGKIFHLQGNCLLSHQMILSSAFNFRYWTLLDISFYYRPPSSQDIRQSFWKYRNVSFSRSTLICEYFVLGDFNAQNAKWLKHSNVTDVVGIHIFLLLNLLSNSGFPYSFP